MIHHVIYRVTSDETDDAGAITDLLEKEVELGNGDTCTVTQLHDQGLIEFDFGIELSHLAVPLPVAARSTAASYLVRILVSMNFRFMELHLLECNEPDHGHVFVA